MSQFIMSNGQGGQAMGQSAQPQPQPNTNPFFQQQAQAQQQPNPFAVRPSYIPGKQITSASDITPGEVPMDGSVSLFYMADCSCIYAKAWTDNGISTIKYIPEPVPQVAQSQTDDEFRKSISMRLDRIEALLAKQQYRKNNYNRNYNNSYKRKEPIGDAGSQSEHDS